ncbi:nitroreductase family deazaflavin-dependent oxidoreductase [Nocardia panacis]|uniref:Nitroreductase family deazaflavin-dependent oxidoreductase n=1 Tax=Nocardia panacis TaxID=2340916 RepID=A0A3A4KDB3_9NOCA|nr:nitroreductase family deazaflavin-dependent oxidoreductase [Nocardia panacis]RJO76711.1 nitroreductase family deazaflavin-dependent oxidoreductase [Nocardia panacis]
MAEQFPTRMWGSRTNALARLANRFAATPVGSWVIRKLTPLDRAVLERTDAKYTVLGPIGAPVILLTTVGRKSGQPRTAPLLYVHDGAVLYVVGSNFGQAHHPAWTANLAAEPTATVAIAGQHIPVTAARVTDPTEQETIFARFVEVTGAYAAYRERTTRDLRIFALRRVRSTDAPAAPTQP